MGGRADMTRELRRWRIGRKLGRTIYEIVGEQASDDDELLGMMDTVELAARVVAAHNARWLDAGVSPATTLARQLDQHLGEHPSRDRDCIVCTVVLAHHESWRQHDDGSDPIFPAPWPPS